MPNWKKVVTSGSNAELDSLKLTGLINAGVDTDKFLVLDSAGNIDFRTGTETLSDINPGGLVSGSSQITISSTTGYTTFSSSIASNIGSITLQDVTDNGSTTTNGVNIIGTVGVGTDNPTYQLHVSSSTSALGVYERAGGASLYLEGQLNRAVLGTVSTHPLLIAYNSAEVARFTGNSFLVTGSLDVSSGITGSDITIDDWGSVSASLASIEAGATSTTLQEVTDNGAIYRRAPKPNDSLADWASTDVNIIITGSLVAAVPGNETQYAHLQGNSLDLGLDGATDTYLKLNGYNGFLKIGPAGSTIDIYTNEDFISVFTSGSNTSYINNYNLYGPPGQVGAYIGQSLQLSNNYGGSGTSATFWLKHRAVGRIGPAGGSSVAYEYLTVEGANYNQTDDVEVNLYGDIIRMSTTTGSFGQSPRIQLRQFGTEVYGNLSVDGSGITGMDGSINASGGITGSDVKINGFTSVSASLADLAGSIGSGTISGIPLGSNLENLVVDNVSLQLNSGTTYNGSSELTISAKTGSVGNGNTTLVSGDGVYDYVNPISASIASDIASIQGSGYVDVSSGGASNRIAIFSDADSLKGDADVTYYSTYNPQSQVYGVWDDVNSEGIKSKTLTTQGIYVGQVGTNFTASIALEANVGPASFYTETKAVGFNVPTTGTRAIHVDTGYAFFINYHLGDGTNYRAGTITINTNYGSSVVFSETSTADLGDTSAHTFSVGYSSGTMTLSMTTTGGVEGTMEVRRMVSI